MKQLKWKNDGECGAGGLPCSHRGVPTKGTFVVVSIGDTNVDTATESVHDHPDGVAHNDARNTPPLWCWQFFVLW